MPNSGPRRPTESSPGTRHPRQYHSPPPTSPITSTHRLHAPFTLPSSAPGKPGPLTGRRGAVSSAASRPEQPKGREGPGPGPAAVAAAASPQPSPIALGQRRRPRVARARGAAAAARCGSGLGEGGAAAGPGPSRGAGASALSSSARARLRRAAGAGREQGRAAREGRQGRGAVCTPKRPLAASDVANPPPLRCGAWIALPGEPAGGRGSAHGELGTPAPDVRSRDCLIQRRGRRGAEGTSGGAGPVGGRAEIRATPTTSPLAPSPPGGRRKERGREGTTGGLEVGVRGVTKRERHFFWR